MFSRATIMDIMDLLASIKTYAELDSYFYRYGLEENTSGGSKIKRTFNIGKNLLENPD